MEHIQRYFLTITIDPKSLKELRDQKYYLYGFRGVSTETRGKPTVWFVDENFGETNHVHWISSVQAYGGLSNEKLSDGSKVSFLLSKNINFGETLDLSDPSGLGFLEFEGDPNYLSITNECRISPSSGSTVACGLSSYNSISNQFTPFCVFPIETGRTCKMKPTDLVFLVFSTEKVEAGSLCSKLAGEGVLIDMSSRERSISFKNSHWEHSVGIEIVQANTDFTSKLIRSKNYLGPENQEAKVALKEDIQNIGERRKTRENEEKLKVGTETKEGLVPQC